MAKVKDLKVVKEEKIEVVNTTEIKNILPNRVKRGRGAGSVYPINNGKTWGICVRFNNANKEQKKQYGERLRYLKTFKTYEDACVGVNNAIANIDELLKDKLEKLGWEESVKTDTEDKTDITEDTDTKIDTEEKLN